MKGVSLLSVKLPVPKELSRFHGELQSEKIPAVTRFLEFSHSEHNSNRGNFEIKGVSLSSKIPTIFGIPKIGSILKPREFYSRGVSFLSVKLSVLKEPSQMEGVSSRPPHAFPIFRIPKIWTITEPREFQVEGVSFHSLKLPVPKELSHFGGE